MSDYPKHRTQIGDRVLVDPPSERDRAAEDIVRERWPKKGPCLVPHKSAATKDSWLLTCHEYDFCLCEMREAARAGWDAALAHLSAHDKSRLKLILERDELQRECERLRAALEYQLVAWRKICEGSMFTPESERKAAEKIAREALGASGQAGDTLDKDLKWSK